MNLELLLWAGTLPGAENATLVDMAVQHGDNTFKYWLRPDGSTYHTGTYIHKTDGGIVDSQRAQRRQAAGAGAL